MIIKTTITTLRENNNKVELLVYRKKSSFRRLSRIQLEFKAKKRKEVSVAENVQSRTYICIYISGAGILKREQNERVSRCGSLVRYGAHAAACQSERGSTDEEKDENKRREEHSWRGRRTEREKKAIYSTVRSSVI